MADEQILLTKIYKGWQNYHTLIIKMLTPLTDEQLALRAAPHLRTVGELAGHIVGVRAGWFHMDMGEGGPEFETIIDQSGPLTVPELIKTLEKTWGLIEECLARWTLADLDYTFHATEDGQEISFTRQWVVWHVLEHDMNHGGEISLTLGMHGLKGSEL